MTKEKIIDGLKFTVDMFLLDLSTGETLTEPRSDLDKVAIDACKGAIELLEQELARNDMFKKHYKVVRTYDDGTVMAGRLQEAFDEGYEFVRVSEYIPEACHGDTRRFGYMEYILVKTESEEE